MVSGQAIFLAVGSLMITVYGEDRSFSGQSEDIQTLVNFTTEQLFGSDGILPQVQITNRCEQKLGFFKTYNSLTLRISSPDNRNIVETCSVVILSRKTFDGVWRKLAKNHCPFTEHGEMYRFLIKNLDRTSFGTTVTLPATDPLVIRLARYAVKQLHMCCEDASLDTVNIALKRGNLYALDVTVCGWTGSKPDTLDCSLPENVHSIRVTVRANTEQESSWTLNQWDILGCGWGSGW